MHVQNKLTKRRISHWYYYIPENVAGCGFTGVGVISNGPSQTEERRNKVIGTRIAQYNGQPFVISYMLDHGYYYSSGFLEQRVVVPVRIDHGQLAGDPIVFFHPHGVKG